MGHAVPLLRVSPPGSYLRSVSDLDGLIGNSHDFHRALGVTRHVFRNAAKQETLHAFSPVGTQNDEICSGLHGRIKDLPSDVTDLDYTVRFETRSAKLLDLSLHQLVRFLNLYLKLRGTSARERQA